MEEQLAELYGAYAISALLSTPFFGYLAQRFGSRSIVLCGVALAAVAATLFGSASSFHTLLLARLCQGAASAALWIAGLAVIAAHYVEKRVEMIGYAFTGSTAGSVLGPVAGGLLAHAGGYKLPFLITGVLLAIDTFLIVLVVPRGLDNPTERPAIRSLLLNGSLLRPALAVAMAAFAVGFIEPLLPAHLASYGVTSKATGLIFTIATLVFGLSAPIVGRLTDRFSIHKIVLLGTVTMAVTLPVLPAFKAPALVCLIVALVYVSYAFMLNPASAELANVADRAGMSSYSAVYAVYNSVYSIGMLATAALASTAARRLGFFGILASVSAVLLLCLPFLTSMKPPIAAPRDFAHQRKNTL
jgi:predicted MFS family arabinose efflux permease